MIKRQKGIRYVVAEGAEAECQPGSRGSVLKNLLGITKKTGMDQAEYEALVKTQEIYVERVGPDDFEGKEQENARKFYLAAVTRGYAQDYEPLTTFFSNAIMARLEKRE
jgi:hypothetical protein